jgi:tetratricopeptide (TPR) repeat protein
MILLSSAREFVKWLIVKAFLSHSSTDKEFVEAVAKELGRQFCVVDRKSFETGVEFKDSIQKGLDESSVFVLFASEASLKSVWVEFEYKEAWFQVLQKHITQSLVYILDTAIDYSDLPKWLQRAKAVRPVSPKAVAREIREHLDDILREKQQPYFVGRTTDIERIQATLSPVDGSSAPRVVVVCGLPGIGRRAFVRHTTKSLLNLHRHVVVKIEEGDDAKDIAIKVADLVEPYSTQEGFQRIVGEIQSANDDAAVIRIVQDLNLLASNGELPLLYDSGGLLDSEGRFSKSVYRIISAIVADAEAYMFIVSSRRPRQGDPIQIPVLQIAPLKHDDVKVLIASVANRNNLHLSAREISDVAEYVGGFPPASYYAIQLAKDYGMALVMADKYRLVDFRASSFMKYLNEKKLTKDQMSVLRILAEYSPLPLPVIGEVVGLDARQLGDSLVNLIDFAFVVADESGYYWLADPISDAVIRTNRLLLKREQHLAIASSLERYLQSLDTDGRRLDLARVLFRAASRAKAPHLSDVAFKLASDVIGIVGLLYHHRDYETAIKFGREAVNLRPESESARSFLIRALIQQEHWEDAETELSRFSEFAPAREVYFLRGFLQRRKGNIPEAIRLFNEAEKLGRTGVAIKRELAWCHFILNDFEGAIKHLEAVEPAVRDNKYVIDLWVQIATKQGNEASARERLAQLEAIDGSGFYFHRLSIVEATFGDLPRALAAALKAVEMEEPPSFEMVAQLALCEMRLGDYAKAEGVVDRLDNEFSQRRPEVRLGLRCRLELYRKHYGRALKLSDRARDKNNPFFKAIRAEALRGELQTAALTDGVRAQYKAELAELERDPKLKTAKAPITIGDVISQSEHS